MRIDIRTVNKKDSPLRARVEFVFEDVGIRIKDIQLLEGKQKGVYFLGFPITQTKDGVKYEAVKPVSGFTERALTDEVVKAYKTALDAQKSMVESKGVVVHDGKKGYEHTL